MAFSGAAPVLARLPRLGSVEGTRPSDGATVPRPGLIARLMAVPDAAVALIVAPAGYGKTTLLAEWAEIDPRPFVWLRVVPGDDDPARLAESLADGLTSVGLKLGPLADRSAIVEELPRAARALKKPLVLVLDDAHKLRRRATLQLLGDLIDS